MTDACHGGSATGATDQGVTSSQIMAGVLTDVGFTKDPQLETTAKVFTDWCNAAGGIDGRKLVADIHDTQMLDVVRRDGRGLPERLRAGRRLGRA